MELQLSTVMLQLATGGLAFTWVTTRGRVVGIGYGWTMRITWGLVALVGIVGFSIQGRHGAAGTVAFGATIGLVIAAAVALTVSVVRRTAGVSGQRALKAARAERVAAMMGDVERPDAESESRGREFPPALDLIAPAIGVIGLVAVAAADGGPYVQNLVRLLVGAAFLGAVSDAMLLGHWYLVQPGLSRDPIKELVKWAAIVWPLDVLVWIWPVGMIGVLTGSVDDGWDGLLGWTWAMCAVTTIGLIVVTWKALQERYYSAVMAATGLMYLAILTAFGQDLIARAVLSV